MDKILSIKCADMGFYTKQIKGKNMVKKPVFINADTGIDDATAIVAGAFSDSLNIKGILSSKGNITVEQVTKNTLALLKFIKKDKIPVYKGMEHTIGKTSFSVVGIHGRDGIGGYVFPPVTEKASSWEDFVKDFMAVKGKVSIICLSPLTNLAKLLSTYPQSREKIDRIIIECGLLNQTGFEPSFNVASDPVAAEIVFNSGLNITICPSDMGHTAYLSHSNVRKIKTLGKTGEMLEFIYRSYKDRVVKDGIATHDSCAVACLDEPELFKYKKAKIGVKYIEPNHIGEIDFDFKSKTPNADVCVKVKKREFRNYLIERISRAP